MVRNIGLGAPWNLEPCLELSINRGQAVTGDRLQCTTIQCNIVQFNTVQCNTVQFNAVQCNTVQCNTMQFNTVQCNTVQCNTAEYSATGCIDQQQGFKMYSRHAAQSCWDSLLSRAMQYSHCSEFLVV